MDLVRASLEDHWKKEEQQAGAELGQAQLKLWLDFEFTLFYLY